MEVLFSESTELSVLDSFLSEMEQNPVIKSAIVFGCDENDWLTEDLNKRVKQSSLSLLGGIYPQVIHETKQYQKGVVVVGLDEEVSSYVIQGLSDSDSDFEGMLDELVPEDQVFDTVYVAVDGLATQIRSFVDSLFSLFGSDISYVGGGAGSLSFVQKPCVISNQGVSQDAAVIGLFPQKLPVKVGHGWVPFSTDHQVTAVDKNVVKEIDYQNALSLYESIISAELNGRTINRDNFFECAQSFPLGIRKLEGEHIVRDPIAINEEGHLICVGELSEGDYIDILTAEKNQLIEAAGETAEGARNLQLNNNSPERGVLFIDCISRVLFLDDEFNKELQQVKMRFADDTPLFGALVLGEIANSGTGYLEFYNKTSVVAVL